MAAPFIQTAFATGEVTPGLFGHVDLAKFHSGAATFRNMIVSYRGGAYSRAGTAFVGFSKQTGRAYPPRMIPFQFSIIQGLALEFGHLYMRVISNGAYVLENFVAVTAATKAVPAVITSTATYATGDWVFISGVSGMTQLNGQTYTVQALGGNAYALYDAFGNPIDSTGFNTFTAGGAVARLFTLVTPWAEQDLAYLKFTQSADIMSITCVNQQTLTEYAPQDLARVSNTNWTLTPVVAAPTVVPPTATTAVPTSAGTTFFQYKITSVNLSDGTESTASAIAGAPNSVNIGATAGSITIGWTPAVGVQQYNIYKALPGYGTAIPVGSSYGYIGSSLSNAFLDSNITPDLGQVPPQHSDPFARGKIIGVTVTNAGTGYTTSCTATITSGTGAGGQLECVVDPVTHGLASVIIDDNGSGYVNGDTVAISGNGAGATATLVIGAQSGTYPSVVAYFQQRRVYANTLNNPDTYFLSQPGSYKNFNYRIPTVASDSITGTPWAVQVDGIQFVVPMPGGLVVLTGVGAWQLTGAGGSSLNPQPITPSSQQAQPQAYNGCSATVPPIKIGAEILYVQAKGSIYLDFTYNYFTNIYIGADLTNYSSHLFTGRTIREHAWAEEPYKVLWSVRDDGTMISMTFVKDQQINGWTRHDTNGSFVSVCSIVEPPVDALYLATKRYFARVPAYFVERMDNRLWTSSEDCWCVDCGLKLVQPTPNAILYASSATGQGSISGVTGLVGGSNYSAGTTVSVVDDNGTGPGSGAVATATIVAGVITGIVFSNGGGNYRYPQLVFDDPSNFGSGASATCVLNNTLTFGASAAVFSGGNVGDIIRMGGGRAVITAFSDSQNVTAQILDPITAIRPGSGGQVQPQAPGLWTMTTPVNAVAGLTYLAGLTVTGTADGTVIPPTVVPANGIIALPIAATSVIVGLGFQAQLQSIDLDAGEPTVQGQRKKIAAVTARIEASRGIKVGANQPNGSWQNPPQIAPQWAGLSNYPDLSRAAYNSAVLPLYTGDVRVPVGGGYDKPGQVAFQQDNPLPMQILAAIPEVLGGDKPEMQASPKQQPRGR